MSTMYLLFVCMGDNKTPCFGLVLFRSSFGWFVLLLTFVSEELRRSFHVQEQSALIFVSVLVNAFSIFLSVLMSTCA